jgi:hypothetical protein
LTEDAKDTMVNFLDDLLSKGTIVEYVSWVLGIVPLCDVRDVALGYVIGETMNRYSVLIKLSGHEKTAEDFEKLLKVFREKLPRIAEKIEAELGE